MKKIVLAGVMVLVSSSAFADLGSMLKAVQSNPALAQQASLSNLVGKINAISTAFSQMPANSGKLDFLKAAMPVLTKANTVGQAKPTDVSQIGGLLDQVKGLLAKKWSDAPLSTAQVPQATAQSQQFASLLGNLLKNESGALKGLLPASTATK
jgi:hypothetical protein